MPDSPTKTALDALKISRPDAYIDVFEFEDNPLIVVLPLPGRNFFGTCVCNVLGITKVCDGTGVADQIAYFKTVYERFIHYETHIWIDDEGFDGDPASTDGILSGIAADLAGYGFTYHGILAPADIGDLVTSLFTTFQETVRDKFS